MEVYSINFHSLKNPLTNTDKVFSKNAKRKKNATDQLKIIVIETAKAFWLQTWSRIAAR